MNVIVEVVVYYWFAYKRFKSTFRIEGDSYRVRSGITEENYRSIISSQFTAQQSCHQYQDNGVRYICR